MASADRFTDGGSIGRRALPDAFTFGYTRRGQSRKSSIKNYFRFVGNDGEGVLVSKIDRGQAKGPEFYIPRTTMKSNG